MKNPNSDLLKTCLLPAVQFTVYGLEFRFSPKHKHSNRCVPVTEVKLVIVFSRTHMETVDMKEVITSPPDSGYKANQVRILQ